jgi:hypothetical protein
MREKQIQLSLKGSCRMQAIVALADWQGIKTVRAQNFLTTDRCPSNLLIRYNGLANAIKFKQHPPLQAS